MILDKVKDIAMRAASIVTGMSIVATGYKNVQEKMDEDDTVGQIQETVSLTTKVLNVGKDIKKEVDNIINPKIM